MKVRIFYILLIIVFTSNCLSAQSMNSVQFPTSMKWKQIETEYFIVIFPADMEEEGKEFAALIDSCVLPNNYSIKTKPKKWPILINTTKTESNGYVAGIPEHSQLYMLPGQDSFLGSADWFPMLWTHELRHILQSEKMKRGFTSFAGWIFGNYGTALMSHFALPSWVWEGDAVLTETLLSTAGRGRLAEFDRGLRTRTLNHNRYSYAKASLNPYGSYKTRGETWYVMGYHMCTYIRKEYGIEKFNEIIEIAGDFSSIPLILNIAVKKVTGKSIEDVYTACLDDLYKLWSLQLEDRTITESNILLEADVKSCADYYPVGTFKNGDIAVLRKSASALPTLLRLDSNKQLTKLRKIYPADSALSFNGETFCWTETTADPRWGNVTWSRIRVYNTKTGEFRLFTQKSRYVSPSISPNGEKIAAIEFSSDLKTFLVILDSNSEEVLKRVKMPEGFTAMQTCWSDDDTVIYIRQGNFQNGLRKYNLASEKDSTITEPSTINISKPYATAENVYYTSEESGIESIHVTNILTGKSELLVSRPYAASNPVVSQNKLLFADYSINGFSIAEAELKKLKENKDELQKEIDSNHVDYFAGLESQEKYAGYLCPSEEKEQSPSLTANYEIKDYSIASGFFNFHSRFIGTPLSGNGITLDFIADNVLSNSSSRLYFGYDPQRREAVSGFQGIWSGFYPILLYGAELEMPIDTFGKMYNSNLYSGLNLPFNFSSGIYNNLLTVQSTFFLYSKLYPETSHAPLLHTSASWSFLQKKAKRDIIPNLGLNLSSGWIFGLVSTQYNFLYAETNIFLPGILDNHGLQLNLGANYNFKNAKNNYNPRHLPKGLITSDYEFPFLINTGIEYMLPVFHPDLDLFNAIYISRVSVAGFFDTAFGNDSISTIFAEDTNVLMTTGLEFIFDFNLFLINVPLRGGVRVLYDFTNEHFRIEDSITLSGVNL